MIRRNFFKAAAGAVSLMTLGRLQPQWGKLCVVKCCMTLDGKKSSWDLFLQQSDNGDWRVVDQSVEVPEK